MTSPMSFRDLPDETMTSDSAEESGVGPIELVSVAVVRGDAFAGIGPRPGRHARILACAGLAALALGTLVYLADRPAEHASLIPSVATLAGMRLFGAVGQWLPSFAHPLAFGLFTAAVLPAGSRWAGRACALWGAVNVVFEFGQHPAVSLVLASRLVEIPEPTGAARALASYFIHGTWDPGDVAAAVLGAICAVSVLRLASHLRENDHD